MSNRTEDIREVPRLSAGDEARFWALVEKTDTCWVWKGKAVKSGHGLFYAATETLLAHRVSWRLHRGRIKGKRVLHRCDNPPCVRPDHLFSGSQRENVNDAIAKGRWTMPPSGEQHHSAKLTESDVRAIRATAGSHAVVARQFGVSKRLILLIRKGRIWRNVA